MLDGADEKPQLSAAKSTKNENETETTSGNETKSGTESGPRHLRPRRGRHAAHIRVVLKPAAALAALPVRVKGPRRDAYLLPVAPNDRMRRGLATAAVLAVAAFGLAAVPLPGKTQPSGTAVSLAEDTDRADAGSVASRGRERAARPESSRSPKATQSSPPKTAQPTRAPTRPAPVGGLSQAEMDNAIAIVDVAKRENLPKRAAIVALSTALQESHLRNLANPNLPQSLGHPNQGVGYDYDSVGLFQQRPNWGNIDQLMDPHESARRFYAALVRIPGWGDYAITTAAQMVQRSAFPDAYAKWESLATQIADATMQ
jgi:hypothetical protein